MPGSYTTDRIKNVGAMIKKYMADDEFSGPGKDKVNANFMEDGRLYKILTELSGCYYLPLSSDFTVHNKSVFDSIIGSLPGCP